MAGAEDDLPHDGLRRLDHDGHRRKVRFSFIGRCGGREDQEDRRPDEGRVREAHAQRKVAGDGVFQREAGEDGEPVRAGYPECGAGETRRARGYREREVTFSAAYSWTFTVLAAVCAAFTAVTASAADPDPDLQAVQTVCGRCHTTDVFLNKPRSWDRWNDVFADMTKRGANGTDEQLARVTA